MATHVPIPRRRNLQSIIVLILTVFPLHALSLVCNTNQNPYCSGNSQFEQLCCNYPNVCYWSDRSGTPACCLAGQDCQAAGGSIVYPTTIYSTVIRTITSTTQPYSTTTTTLTHPTTAGGVVVVTTTQASVIQGTTTTVAGASTAAAIVLVGNAPRPRATALMPALGALGVGLWQMV